MTSTEPAQQVTGHGATLAGDVTQRRTQSAEARYNVIDVGTVDEASFATEVCHANEKMVNAAGERAIAAQFDVVRAGRKQIAIIDKERGERRDTQPSPGGKLVIAQQSFRLGFAGRTAISLVEVTPPRQNDPYISQMALHPTSSPVETGPGNAIDAHQTIS